MLHLPVFKTLILALLGAVLFLSCGRDDPEWIAQKDREKILEYIAENELDAREHESGLFYVIEREGDDRSPGLYTPIRMNYEGSLLNGRVFDFRTNAVIRLSNTIRGWQYGIPLFGAGGRGFLLIPSALGYGSFPQYGIPENSVLVFYVEIIDF